MNFWAKLLNIATNIFIVVGIIGAIIFGGFFGDVPGLLICVGGVFVVLLSASVIKILLYTSRDLALCKEYLKSMTESPNNAGENKCINKVAEGEWIRCHLCTRVIQSGDKICVHCGKEYK
jgi:hypothetical protein